MVWPLHAVAETASYLSWAQKHLSDEEQGAIVDSLAANPEQGVILQDSGGIRKARFGIAGRGKRGGVRIIYYFHSEILPVYILAGFAKNERDDLSPNERHLLRELVRRILASRGVSS